MILRRAALALAAVVAACSGEPAPEPEPVDIGDGDHVGIEAPDESWTLDRFSAAEDLTERSTFGPVVAFDVGGGGAAVATVVEVPAPVVESQGSYLGPFVRPAARAVGGRTVVVSGRGGVDPDEVVDRIGMEGGRPVAVHGAVREVGALPEGWELPGAAVRFSARHQGRYGEMTAYLVDAREQAALRHLLVDDPRGYPPDPSAPQAEVRPPRRVEAEGRTGWLGQTSPYDRVVVLHGDPGVALVSSSTLEDDELVSLAAAVRAVDDDTWEASRRRWLEEVRVLEEEAAADDVRMAVFLAQGRELWRERVGQTLHVLYEPGPGSDLHGRLCTGTVVIPLGWEGRRIGQSCALPPVPHVSAARSGRSNEVWGLATADVAAVEVRSSDGVATARLVDAGGHRWWVAAVPGEATELGVVARDGAGRVLQDLAFVT